MPLSLPVHCRCRCARLQLKAEANALRTRAAVKKRERIARIKGALSDWGRVKPRGDPDEDYKLPKGIDMTFLLTEDKGAEIRSNAAQVCLVVQRVSGGCGRCVVSHTPPCRRTIVRMPRFLGALRISSSLALCVRVSCIVPRQYEAFDRYYESPMGAGAGAWGAFTGVGIPVPADRILIEGEAAVPFDEMSTCREAAMDGGVVVVVVVVWTARG